MQSFKIDNETELHNRFDKNASRVEGQEESLDRDEAVLARFGKKQRLRVSLYRYDLTYVL